MDTTCQPHILHMVVQGRLHSSEHRPLVVVYKVDQFVERSLLSSLVLFLYKSYSFVQPLGLKFITLELDFHPKDYSTQSLLTFPLTSFSSLTEGQHSPLVKKILPDPRHKEHTSQVGKAQPSICIKAHWYISDISPFVDMLFIFFHLSALYYRLLCSLSMQRNNSLFLKQKSRVEYPFQNKIVYISFRAVVSRRCKQDKKSACYHLLRNFVIFGI